MSDVSVGCATPGQIIAGKYKVLHLLGRGGMGEVVAAEHLQLRHTVAIKLMTPRAGLASEVVVRFLQEARATVRLRNEHIARVIDMGTLDTGLPYIVMEHLDGRDFEHILRAGGRLPVDEAVSIILQACEGLAEAHAAGIVHRDLKPSNLFLTQMPDGRSLVKVLDFGISKISEEFGGEGITDTADVLGTPAYMSPEQIRSAKLVDARTDIWALGLILAECLTGKPVYDARKKLAVLAMIAADPVPTLSLDETETPPALQEVILRCLQKDPDRRYQNVAELAAELMPFGGSHSSASVARIGRLLQSASAARRSKARLRRGFLAATWTAAAALLALLGQRLYATWGAAGVDEPPQTLVRPPDPKPDLPVRLAPVVAMPEGDAGAFTPSSIEVAPNQPVQRKTSPKGTGGGAGRPPRSNDPRAPPPDGLQDRK